MFFDSLPVASIQALSQIAWKFLILFAKKNEKLLPSGNELDTDGIFVTKLWDTLFSLTAFQLPQLKQKISDLDGLFENCCSGVGSTKKVRSIENSNIELSYTILEGS